MSEEISYQAKDILMKRLNELYKSTSLKVYGLDLPAIKNVLPTNLPDIKINERRADNIFELVDDSILLTEYESDPRYIDLIKYADYAFKIAERYCTSKLPRVKLLVIYTGDVESAPSFLDLEDIYLNFRQVFLSKFDGQKMYEDVRTKIKNNDTLTSEDVMKLILSPLTKKNDKQKLVEDAIELAKEVKDEDTKNLMIAGIIAASYKFIDGDYLSKVERWIRMTGLERIFDDLYREEKRKILKEKEEEKIEALNELAQKKDMEKLGAVHETEIETQKKIARNMLKKNADDVFIMEITGLTKAQILNIKNENFIN
ncbi:MAG: hypothetical protein FWC47_06300 [Oscillospiraceae bacterium]|nr:hypothetical protein [Oscillospiraceae bacterium]